MKEVLLIFLGGGTGSTLRFLVQQFAGKFYAGIFPLGTLLVNITGSFLIGLALGCLGTAYIILSFIICILFTALGIYLAK